MTETPPVIREDQQPLTVQEVARFLRCDQHVIYREVRDGNLRGVRVGRTIRITPGALADYLGENGGADQ